MPSDGCVIVEPCFGARKRVSLARSARLWGGRAEHAAAAAGDAQRRMRDRRAVLRDAEEVLLGLLDALLDRQRDLAGLAVADADDVALVTHHDQRGEREAAGGRDRLRGAGGRDAP